MKNRIEGSFKNIFLQVFNKNLKYQKFEKNIRNNFLIILKFSKIKKYQKITKNLDLNSK